MRAERVLRGTVIAGLGLGAGYISLRHVYSFTMEYSAPGTHWTTGVIVAAVSELMPLGVALNARLTGKLGNLAIGLLVLAGAFSLLAQVMTADPSVFGYIVAAFPTLAFMGLVKLMLHDDAEPVNEDAHAPTVVRVPVQEDRPEPALGDDEPEPVPAAPPAPSGTAATAGGGKRKVVLTSASGKAERIVDARRELGPDASLAEVGALAGYSASTISRFEAGLRKQEKPVLRAVV